MTLTLAVLFVRLGFSSYRVAAVHLALGDRDRAFEWLERAYVERDAWLICLNVDPVLDDLCPDPRFVALARRIGLAASPDEPSAN